MLAWRQLVTRNAPSLQVSSLLRTCSSCSTSNIFLSANSCSITNNNRTKDGLSNSNASMQKSWLSSLPRHYKPSGPGELVPVQAITLNNLYDNPGAVKKHRRIGRGIGSSKGKTSGRGHKGQKSRSGGSIPLYFEGGQTPIHKRLPKRGFRSKNKEKIAFNVGVLHDNVAMGRFPGVGDKETNPINMKHMVDAGVIKANTVIKRGGVKLLADGKDRVKTPIHIVVGWASEEAIATIEAAGGTVRTVHYNAVSLRDLVKTPKKGLWYRRPARPPPKYQPYYTSMRMRGYLHPAMQLRKWFKIHTDKLGGGEVSDVETKFNEIRERQREEDKVRMTS